MVNIWEFILQTVSVSLVAGVLLITKAIFKDKLTPRWQYGIWIILVLRILIPVKADRFVLLPFGLYLEIAKNHVESRLTSAFSSAFSATEPSGIIPYITSSPRSITDILFVIYVVGVVAFLCFYLLAYIKLRIILKKGNVISPENNENLQRILAENRIKKIRVVSVEGINSAFIYGIFSPVLVLPYGRETDKKVLLHEIMHLKHLDSLQNIFWCILRCLHWCNPFMHYVFNIIGNDTEMLCDQRVLEKLTGEKRREYGILLLNEVNRKYARMPGTTSVSNGGRNISKRIEAIVRFKKYPKGMALVSVCIVILLSLPCLFVSAGYSADNSVYFPETDYEFQKSVAYSQINRCTTVAGAIDTYAKSLTDNNGIMLLTVSPTEKHEEILASLHDFYMTDDYIETVIHENGRPFSVFNFIKTEKDKYSAILIFSIAEEEKNENTDEIYHVFGDTLLVPIEIFKENNSWVVKETAERKKSKNHLAATPYEQTHNLGEDCPLLYESVQNGENGSLTVNVTTIFQTDYDVISSDNMSFFTDAIGYDSKVHLDADFSGCIAETNYIYKYNGGDIQSVGHVAIEYTSDLNAEFSPEKGIFSLNSASSSTDGSGRRNYKVNDGEPWDGTITFNDLNSNISHQDLSEGFNATTKVAIYIDGKLADVFTAEVKTNGN